MKEINIGALLKACRINKDYSQQRLAVALLIDRSTVSRIESGELIPDEFIIRRWADETNSRHLIAAYFAGEEGFNDLLNFRATMSQVQSLSAQLMQVRV